MARPPHETGPAAPPRLNLDPSSPSRHNHFTSIPLDRMAERRDDRAQLDALRSAPRARFLPLFRSRCLLRADARGQRPVHLAPQEAATLTDTGRATLLGDDGHCTWFAVAIDESQRDHLLEAYPGADFHDLRRALDLDDGQAGILAYARALLYWQYRNAHCGSCGAPNRIQSAGHRLVCSAPACGRESFPRIDPAIIVLVTHGDACLLGHNPRWPERRYSTLAGYVEPGESLEDAVAREVYEEACVRLVGVRYLSSQPWPFPASLMCGFRAQAQSRDSRPTDELESLLWLTAPELRAAIESDRVRLPPPLSIAFRLIAEWYRERSGEELEPLVRRAGSWLGRKRIE